MIPTELSEEQREWISFSSFFKWKFHFVDWHFAFQVLEHATMRWKRLYYTTEEWGLFTTSYWRNCENIYLPYFLKRHQTRAVVEFFSIVCFKLLDFDAILRIKNSLCIQLVSEREIFFNGIIYFSFFSRYLAATALTTRSKTPLLLIMK